MPQKGEQTRRTASLFPELTPSGQRRSENLREAAALFDVTTEPTDSDDSPTRSRDLHTGDLFAWGARQEQIRLRGTSTGVSIRSAESRSFLSGPSPTEVRSRRSGLMRCLDGSGPAVGQVGQGRRVSRNRVLFSILVVGVTFYVILWFILGR